MHNLFSIIYLCQSLGLVQVNNKIIAKGKVVIVYRFCLFEK